MQFHRTTIIRELASQIERYQRCSKDAHFAHAANDAKSILANLSNVLPHGSGIDNGVAICIDDSSEHKIVLRVSYHHMNDVGMYAGWTEHRIVVTPSFAGFDLSISGRNRNEIKDYLHDVISQCLQNRIDVYADGDIREVYCDERTPTKNETDRFYQIFDPIYSGA